MECGRLAAPLVKFGKFSIRSREFFFVDYLGSIHGDFQFPGDVCALCRYDLTCRTRDHKSQALLEIHIIELGDRALAFLPTYKHGC